MEETQTSKTLHCGNNHEKLLLWLISLDSTALWSQKLLEALTHRGLPGCLPIWPSRGLATMLHYKSREQIEAYWVGRGVGFWVGCCSINSAHRHKIKFERQIDLLDLVDRGGCTWIIRWENYLINEKIKNINWITIKLHYQTLVIKDVLFLYLQACGQFWLLQIVGYFDAKYSGCFIYNTPFIPIDGRQSFDLFNLNERKQ